MGCRQGRPLTIIIALAFVDLFIPNARTYIGRKAAIAEELTRFLEADLQELDRVDVCLNMLDHSERGLGGMYLTVLGTSAEGGDSGRGGRGNRVNGVISLNRPMSTEAAAGKNPVSHVGKIYALLSHQMAQRIVTAVGGVAEVSVWLCSQIGQPVDCPWTRPPRSFWCLAPAGRRSTPRSARSCTPTWRRCRPSSPNSRKALSPCGESLRDLRELMVLQDAGVAINNAWWRLRE